MKPSDYCWHIYENKVGQYVMTERRFKTKTEADAFFAGVIKYNADHIVFMNTFNEAHDPYKQITVDDGREFVYKYGPGKMTEGAREEYIIYYQQ